MNIPTEVEEWRACRYVGYEVSNLGRFRSYWKHEKITETPRIKSIIKNNGRAKVGVKSGAKNTIVLFSRIVAEEFLGDPDGRVVLFKDEDHMNCRADNLYYATKKEAGYHLREMRLREMGSQSTLGRGIDSKKKSEERLRRALRVKQLRDEGKTYKEIGDMVGLSESGAFRIMVGKNNTLLERAQNGK